MTVPVRRAVPVVACLLATIGTGCTTRSSIRFVAERGERGAGFFEAGPLTRSQLAALEADWPEAAPEILPVRVAAHRGAAGSLPPIAGEYRLSGSRLRFEPRYPLTPGVAYRARFHRSDGTALDFEVSIPEEDVERSTVVEAVYPSRDTLPENLLKFYVHFSAPMSQGQAWRHLRLLDGKGHVVDFPFLELDEELWDRGVRRLTVLIDPGRIKRGVRPLEEVGPALVEGGTFTLEVDSGWEDARGVPLARGLRKEFRVGPPDRTAPDAASWKVSSPRRGSREALTVAFDEPLDNGLLRSAMGIEGPDGQGIEGTVETADEETRWRFTPVEPWADGEHRVVASTTLEDLAGNSLGRPFEVDTTEPVRRQVAVDVVRLPFRPQAGR